jgi:hypothetical protein
MRGFPKYLNTKADYDYVKTHFPPEKRERNFFGMLIEDSKKFFEVRILAEGEKITPTATQKVVEEVEAGTNRKIQILLELQPDPNCKMARLGIKESDIVGVGEIPNEEITPIR